MIAVLDVALKLAATWGATGAFCVLMYILFCSTPDSSDKVEAKKVAMFALWPLVLLLLVIRGAREACEWAMHGDSEEPEVKP